MSLVCNWNPLLYVQTIAYSCPICSNGFDKWCHERGPAVIKYVFGYNKETSPTNSLLISVHLRRTHQEIDMPTCEATICIPRSQLISNSRLANSDLQGDFCYCWDSEDLLVCVTFANDENKLDNIMTGLYDSSSLSSQPMFHRIRASISLVIDTLKILAHCKTIWI